MPSMGRTDQESSEYSLISLIGASDFDSTIRRFESSRPMRAVQHVFRRGAVYWWRRRLLPS
jgi:hypothetical protein